MGSYFLQMRVSMRQGSIQTTDKWKTCELAASAEAPCMRGRLFVRHVDAAKVEKVEYVTY